jgi:hypothetical protein
MRQKRIKVKRKIAFISNKSSKSSVVKKLKNGRAARLKINKQIVTARLESFREHDKQAFRIHFHVLDAHESYSICFSESLPH